MSSTPAALAVAVIVVVLVYFVLGFTKTEEPITAPPIPTTTTEKTTKKICVVGAGTIGSSFVAVYLAQGCDVICADPHVSREKLEQRVQEYWPVLQARDKIKTLPQSQPPFGSLTLTSNLQEAVKGIDFVQECAFEEVDVKQDLLAQLDDLVHPEILIASSTSFIPWNLLAQNCLRKHRILIGHPAIPHTHSFMEIYGPNPEWTQYCKQWYQNVGFDVIVMHKTLPGHVLNSFLRVNLDHATSLIQDGVVSAQDCNTAMRHFGRDVYGRHALVALRTMIGGDRGFVGGTELATRITKDAVYLILFSGMKKHNIPDAIARPVGRTLGRWIAKMLPASPDEWLQACQDYEATITNGGQIPVQTAYFQATLEMYKRVPFEPENDPLKITKPSS